MIYSVLRYHLREARSLWVPRTAFPERSPRRSRYHNATSSSFLGPCVISLSTSMDFTPDPSLVQLCGKVKTVPRRSAGWLRSRPPRLRFVTFAKTKQDHVRSTKCVAMNTHNMRIILVLVGGFSCFTFTDGERGSSHNQTL